MAKTIHLLRALERYPVFNNKTFRDLTGKGSNYARLLMHRLKKGNLIYKLGRNRYTLQKDPLVVASYIVWPAYLSAWTALRYHNFTEQLPETIWVITTRQYRKVIKFHNTKIRFIIIKPKFFFGYRKERYNDFDIFMAEPEKAINDSIIFRKVSASEIFDIVKNHVSEIDSRRAADYLLRMQNKSAAKRLGYMLESAGKDCFGTLKQMIDSKYVLLDPALPMKGKKNHKWKVIENVKL